MEIFLGQSLLRLVVNTGVDLSSASVVRLYYTKPSGESGFWPATSTSNTTLLYDVQVGDIDEHGLWRFQSYAEIGSRVGLGQIYRLRVYPPLQ